MGRSSNWQKQHQADEDFTRAAWDSLVDTEKEHKVQVTVVLVPTAQRGVWYLEMGARSTVLGEEGRMIASYQGSYPNGRAAALSAYFYAAANALGQMVEASRNYSVYEALKSIK